MDQVDGRTPLDVSASGAPTDDVYEDEHAAATIRIGGLSDVIDEVTRDSDGDDVAELKRFVIAYNEFYAGKHLERDSSAPVVAVNPFQVLLPRTGGGAGRDPYLGLAESLVENHDEQVAAIRPLAADIEAAISTGDNLVVVSNHVTFLGLPAIIALVSEVIRGDDASAYHQFLDRLHILMSAVTLTHEFYRTGVLSYANVIQTRPGVESGNVPGYEEMQGRQGRRAVKEISRIFGESSGKILLATPSGTTDHWVADDAGLSHVVMAEPTPATVRLFDDTLGHVAKVAVAMNDHEVLADHKSGQVVGGSIYVHAGPIHQPDTEGATLASLMEEIRGSIPDGRGGVVPAEIVPYPEMP